jgi:hypothetical protein
VEENRGEKEAWKRGQKQASVMDCDIIERIAAGGGLARASNHGTFFLVPLRGFAFCEGMAWTTVHRQTINRKR